MESNKHLEDLDLTDSFPAPRSSSDEHGIDNLHLDGHLGTHSAAAALYEETKDSDIYRGERVEAPVPIGVQHSDDFERSSVASSSSSSSLNVGRRLGGLANVVEAAITRWAKLHSSDSSIASSSSSSTDSKTTGRRRPKSHHRTSTATIHSHEQALLLRKRAREQSKAIGREFNLLLPIHLAEGAYGKNGKKAGTRTEGQDWRSFRTLSLAEISSRLDSVLRKSAKHRRMQDRSAGVESISPVDKGKSRATAKESQGSSVFRFQSNPDTSAEKGWWLDVANPTFQDLRELARASCFCLLLFKR